MTDALLQFPWNVAWQSAALLTLGLMASAAWRARPARAHAALGLAAAACLIVPLLGVAADELGLGLIARPVANNRPVSPPPAPPIEPIEATAVPLQSAIQQGQPGNPLGATEFSNAPAEAAHPSPIPAAEGSRLSAASIMQAAITAWAVWTGVLLLTLGFAWVRARRAAAHGVVLDDERLSASLRAAAAHLGAPASVDLRVSPAIRTPAIWCWSRRPVILLPQDWDRAGAMWGAVFAHELAHLRRRDHWWMLAAELVARLCPWNPLGWLARARLGALAERACDDWAVHAVADPCAYAETLLSFTPSRGPRLALAAVSSRRGLAGRIRRILDASPTPRHGRAWGIGAAVFAASAAMATALVRERLPSVGQPAQPAAGDAAARSAAFAERITSLAEGDWRAAFALGQELAAIPPDEGWAILRDNWSRAASVQARQQFLKAWVMRAPDGRTPARLSDRSHARLLDVLDLGMRDESPEVRSWAARYLQSIAFHDFNQDPAAYDAWRKATAGRPLSEVRADSVVDWVARLRRAEPVALDTLREAGRGLITDPEATAAAIKQGLPALLESMFTGEIPADLSDSAGEPVLEAVALFAALKPGEAELRRAVLPLLAGEHPLAIRAAAARALGAPENAWAVQPLCAAIVASLGESGPNAELIRSTFGESLARIKDPSAIPVLIGVMRADEKEIGLAELAGVEYSPFHDAAWWDRWWLANKARYPETVRSVPIPELPRTERARAHTPFPETLDGLDGKLAWIQQQIRDDQTGKLTGTAREIAEHKDPRAIPILIGVIDADNSYDSVYGVGYFGLGKLTDVRYSPYHDGAWWRRWWEANKAKFPEEARAVPIPELPKTASGRAHKPFPEALDTLEGKLTWIQRQLASGDTHGLSQTAREIAEHKDPRAIPILIGVIDADNTYDTIYGVGYFGLGNLTGVGYDERFDGPWWRAWWEKNKHTYPAEAQAVSIPSLPKTPGYVPRVYDHAEWIGTVGEEPVERLLDEIHRRIAAGEAGPEGVNLSGLGGLLADREDPRVIQPLIGMIEADNTMTTIYGIGYFALGNMTGVKFDRNHDGPWWHNWWEQNKARFPAQQSGDRPWWERGNAGAAQPAAQPAVAPALPQPNASPKPIKGDDEIEVADLRAGGDGYKRYLLIGPKAGAAEPPDGWKLLLVLPGGNGSADFHPFVRNMAKRALPDGYLLAQLVAPKWRDDENRAVWPTKGFPDDQMKFSAEEFIAAVVEDTASKSKIDRKHVYALGWSSGGPPVYASSATEGTPLTGAFVAMSVFHPNTMPPLAGSKGKPYYLLHSPTDFIKMRFPEDAKAKLTDAGATVHLETYEGGHGWHGDVFGNIRRGVEWLQSQGR